MAAFLAARETPSWRPVEPWCGRARLSLDRRSAHGLHRSSIGKRNEKRKTAKNWRSLHRRCGQADAYHARSINAAKPAASFSLLAFMEKRRQGRRSRSHRRPNTQSPPSSGLSGNRCRPPARGRNSLPKLLALLAAIEQEPYDSGAPSANQHRNTIIQSISMRRENRDLCEGLMSRGIALLSHSWFSPSWLR